MHIYCKTRSGHKFYLAFQISHSERKVHVPFLQRFVWLSHVDDCYDDTTCATHRLHDGTLPSVHVFHARSNRTLYIDGLVHVCSNSSALAMELLQFCTKPSIYYWTHKSPIHSVILFILHSTRASIHQRQDILPPRLAISKPWFMYSKWSYRLDI